MFRKKIASYLTFSLLSLLSMMFFFSACLKDITIDLPEYESKLVVESYLDSNVPYYIVSVTESVSFFTPSTFPVSQVLPVVEHAIVTITKGNQTDTLQYIDTLKVYVKPLTTPMSINDYEDYHLRVEDTMTNRIATASTRFLPVIPIDTVMYLLNDSLKAAMLMYFYDPKPDENFYKVWFANAANPFERDSLRTWEFSDKALSDGRVSVGMGYNFRVTDTVIVRLYHINEEYYRFLDTVDDAEDASDSPFSRPARIVSNIEGGTGVFVALSYDQRIVPITQ